MKKVIDIIEEVCDDSVVRENLDIDLWKTGLIDSMGFINLLSSLEDEFDVEVDISNITRETMATPNMIIKYIESLR